MFYSLDAEKSILGCVLTNDNALDKLAFLVKPEDFFLAENNVTFAACLELYKQGQSISWLAVFNKLGENPKHRVAEDYLKSLVFEYTVDVDSAATFAVQVSEFAGKRVVKTAIDKLSKTMDEESSSLQAAIQTLDGVIKDTATYGVKGFMSGSELFNEFLEDFDRVTGNYSLLGVPEFDSRITDFSGSEILIVAARPSVGKTAFALQSARKNYEQGKRVLFLTLEMSPKKILLRLIAQKTGIPAWKLKAMSKAEFSRNSRLTAALQYFTSGGFFIETGAPYDLGTILKTISSYKYKEQIDVVYIDYLQLISGTAGKFSENRNQEVSNVSRALKNIAGVLDIPIVLLSQLNRAVENRMFSEPELHDLRESGSVEQDASTVVFLYRDNKGQVGIEQPKVRAEVIEIAVKVGKQRNGEIFTEKFSFNQPVFTFDGMSGLPPQLGLDI